MKCKQEVVKGKKTKRCGNSALEGCDFCRIHADTNKESEITSISTSEMDDVPKNDDIDSLVSAIENLTIVIQEMKNEKKRKAEPKKPKVVSLLAKAKKLLYLDAKNDVNFMNFVADSHNLRGQKIPCSFIKTKSDAYWDTLDTEKQEAYLALASELPA